MAELVRVYRDVSQDPELAFSFKDRDRVGISDVTWKQVKLFHCSPLKA